MSETKRKPGDWLAAAQARALEEPQTFIGEMGYAVATAPRFGKAEGPASFTTKPQAVGPVDGWWAGRSRVTPDEFRALYDGTFAPAEPKPLTLADLLRAERELRGMSVPTLDSGSYQAMLSPQMVRALREQTTLAAEARQRTRTEQAAARAAWAARVLATLTAPAPLTADELRARRDALHRERPLPLPKERR